jgi:hypothetical protein
MRSDIVWSKSETVCYKGRNTWTIPLKYVIHSPPERTCNETVKDGNIAHHFVKNPSLTILLTDVTEPYITRFETTQEALHSVFPTDSETLHHYVTTLYLQDYKNVVLSLPVGKY